MLPVFRWLVPHINPTTTNENMDDDTTYVKNGTQLHFLNTQLNFLNKIEHLPKLYVHGVGTQKKGMWKDSDKFIMVMSKLFEE